MGTVQIQLIEYREVVRVATANNFNCTKKEYKQLDAFTKKYPERYFFVNCNIRTRWLTSINKHPYQAVITANPDLYVDEKLIKKLDDIDARKIGFIRVKWLPDYHEHEKLIKSLLNKGHKVVITIQRWNKKDHIEDWGVDASHYVWDHSRYRLTGESLQYVYDFVDREAEKGSPLYICDRKNLGCGECGLCARLTLGNDVKLSSLNMSSSGLCPYHCPDCYAKAMQQMAVEFEHQPIKFDHIAQNQKQSGRLKKIQDKKAELAHA